MKYLLDIDRNGLLIRVIMVLIALATDSMIIVHVFVLVFVSNFPALNCHFTMSIISSTMPFHKKKYTAKHNALLNKNL